jgi:hypothetical protein
VRVVLAVILLAWYGTASAVVVEQIAAIVNGQIIFLSDLARHRTFFDRANDPMTSLEHLIDEQLLAVEARRFLSEPPSDSEIDASMAQIRQSFQDGSFEEALYTTGWSEAGLRDAVRRQRWIERLLHERVSSFIFISQRTVEEYYQAHRDQYINQPEAEAQQEIRDRLWADKEADKQRDYIQRLRDDAKIQVNLAVGRGPGF